VRFYIVVDPSGRRSFYQRDRHKQDDYGGVTRQAWTDAVRNYRTLYMSVYLHQHADVTRVPHVVIVADEEWQPSGSTIHVFTGTKKDCLQAALAYGKMLVYEPKPM
jgi:hypothetical protein